MIADVKETIEMKAHQICQDKAGVYHRRSNKASQTVEL